MSGYDAVRRVIEHEANQDYDGGFFAKLGGLEPDHAPTGHTLGRDKGGTPVRASYADNTGTGWNANKGRSSGPHLQWVKNTTGKIKDAFTAPFKPKRQPIVKVRRVWRGPNPITGRTFSTWYWQCALCDHNMNPREIDSTHYGEFCFTWADAYRRATHHAHNHHRSGK